MTVLLNLKDRPLKATACGQCQGSSSDNTVRTLPLQDEAAASTPTAQTSTV